jgi:hypothetical protein
VGDRIVGLPAHDPGLASPVVASDDQLTPREQMARAEAVGEEAVKPGQGLRILKLEGSQEGSPSPVLKDRKFSFPIKASPTRASNRGLPYRPARDHSRSNAAKSPVAAARTAAPTSRTRRPKFVLPLPFGPTITDNPSGTSRSS